MSDSFAVEFKNVTKAFGRSEEHTSELQSLVNLVCRLLLEKKKHTPTTQTYRSPHPAYLQLLHLDSPIISTSYA